MQEIPLGPWRLAVEHRVPVGPTLRVRDADGRERLRFDCFEPGAHFHLDPEGDAAVKPIPVGHDSIDWVLAELERDFAGWLARGGAAATPPDPAALRGALACAARAMRHPPLDLDALALDRLRARTGEKWRVYPDDVLPLWVADMDYPVAEPIRRRLHRAVELSDLGYPMHPRPTGLPELFAERAERCFGWRVDPRRVELLTDVVQGMYVGIEAWSERGQGAVVQTPIYPPFLGAVRNTGRALLENRLAARPGGYEIDFDGLRAGLSRDTRLLLLCNPHNPTGRVFQRDELERLAGIALEHDLVVIADELHGELTYPGHGFVPFATLGPEVEARTFTLTAASKAFNIAGMRCAVGVFGSEELRKRFLEVPRHLRGGLGALGIEATRAAWLHGDPWLEQVLAHLAGNRERVARFVAERLPGVVHHPPRATYFAWLDCRALGLEPSPFEFFLERAKVGLSDGRTFGNPGEGCVRLNFATSRPILDEALERMARALESR